MRGNKIAIGFVGLIAVLATVPCVDGFLFKRNYHQFVQALAADNTVSIQILEYHQGWFHSTSKVSIKPKVDMAGVPVPSSSPSGAYMTPSIVLDQVISHGPLVYDAKSGWVIGLAAIQSRIHLPTSVEAVLLGNQPNQNGIIESNAIVSLSGDYLSQFKTPVFNINIPNVISIVWQGLNGTMNFYMQGNRLQKMTTDMVVGAISAKGVVGSVDMKEALIKYEISPESSGLWKGDYQFTAPEFTYTNADQIFAIKGLKTSYAFGSATANLYGANAQFSLDQLTTPQFGVNHSQISMSLENVSTPGLLNLIKTINSFKDNGPDFTPAQSQQLLAIVPQLITSTTLVKQDVAINTSYGRALLNSQIVWPVVVKTMDSVAKEVKGKADIRVSTTLVDQVIAIMAAHEAAARPSPASAISSQQPTEDSLLKEIDSWSAQDKLDLSIGIQVKDLVQAHLKPEDFARNIDKFVVLAQISPDIADQLKSSYAIVRANQLSPTVQAPTPVVAQAASPVDQMREEWNLLIKQGYVRQDKTDYVTTITIEQGVVKANGLEIQKLM